MKKITIFVAISDGVHSGVTASRLPIKEANYLLELNPEVYFKTFSDAKRKVLVHVIEASNRWIAIVNRVRLIKKHDVLGSIKEQ